MILGILDIHMQKNDILACTIDKSQRKWVNA
jgi:hypothetical protein